MNIIRWWVRRREKGVQRTVFRSPLIAHAHDHWTWSMWSGDACWLLIHNKHNARSRFTTLECIYLNSKRLSPTTINAIDFGQLVITTVHLDFNFFKITIWVSKRRKTEFFAWKNKFYWNKKRVLFLFAKTMKICVSNLFLVWLENVCFVYYNWRKQISVDLFKLLMVSFLFTDFLNTLGQQTETRIYTLHHEMT